MPFEYLFLSSNYFNHVPASPLSSASSCTHSIFRAFCLPGSLSILCPPCLIPLPRTSTVAVSSSFSDCSVFLSLNASRSPVSSYLASLISPIVLVLRLLHSPSLHLHRAPPAHPSSTRSDLVPASPRGSPSQVRRNRSKLWTLCPRSSRSHRISQLWLLLFTHGDWMC